MNDTMSDENNTTVGQFDLDSVRREINQIRSVPSKEKLAFEKNQEIATMVIFYLEGRGSFYQNANRVYYFRHNENELLALERDSIELQMTLDDFGLNPSESVYRYVHDQVILHGLKNGERTRIYLGPHYAGESNAVYVPSGRGSMYRVTPDSIVLLPNGTDGILFLGRNSFGSFKFDRQVRRAIRESLLYETIFGDLNIDESYGLSKGQAALTCVVWLFSLFFGSLQSTRVILAQIGPKGSGKTFPLRAILKLFFGNTANVVSMPSNGKDFETILTNNYFVFIDNVDDPRGKWACDLFAVTSTGGNIQRRKLYTTNEISEDSIDCFLAITSRTPHFTRDDVADRLLLLHYLRREGFSAERPLLDKVLQGRDRIMSEILTELQSLLADFSHQVGPPYSGTFRIADFADIAQRIGRSWGCENDITTCLEKMSVTQSKFALQNSSIGPALDLWLERPGNAGREITSSDLCLELRSMAELSGLSLDEFKSTHVFAQFFTHLRPNLESEYKIIEHRHGGRKKGFSFRWRDHE